MIEREDMVYHQKYGKGYVQLKKVGNGVKCKFEGWPFPFVVQEVDLEIEALFPPDTIYNEREKL